MFGVSAFDFLYSTLPRSLTLEVERFTTRVTLPSNEQLDLWVYP